MRGGRCTEAARSGFELLRRNLIRMQQHFAINVEGCDDCDHSKRKLKKLTPTVPRFKSTSRIRDTSRKYLCRNQTMKVALSRSFNRNFVGCGIVIASCVVLWGCGGGDGGGG